jgi:hypothetical protein
MTIANSGGISSAAAVSEQIPVQPLLNYQFQVVCSFASTWASGAEVQLTFYDVNGNNLQTNTSTPSSMTGGVLYQLNTALVTAPAGSSFAVAEIILVGSPPPANALSVYQAEIDDQNFNQVNVNYTFSYTFWPWSALQPSTTLAWNFSNLISGDSDSLSLDGAIELMGGAQGVQCTIPSLLDSNGQGPTFRILAPPSLNSAAYGYEPSYDLNAPQPTQDVVASMLLDGERPFGARASNRTISLPIIIFGTQAGGMNQVLAAREYLMTVIDQQTWQMKWTSADTGLAMIFDCFRALPSSPLYGFNYSAGGSATGQTIGKPNYPIAMITIEVQALPYGRSDIDGVQSLAFSSPVIGGAVPAGAVSIDTFGTVFNPPPVISTPTWTAIGTSNPTSVSTWNITATGTVKAGNTIVVEVESAANTITGVSDSQGNPYTRASVQSTGGACWQSVWTAPVATQITSGTDHVTVTSSGSGSFSSAVYGLTGAWTPQVVFQGSGSASSFSNSYAVSQYAMAVSVGAGLGSAGGTPANFTALSGNSGNGFNSQIAWYAQPINQTTLAYAVGSLPNPYSLTLLAFVPVNQAWVQDTVHSPGSGNGLSVHYQPPRPMHMPWPAAIYSQTLQSTANIVGCGALSVWFGQSYDTQWPKDPKFASNVTLQWTLTDSLGRSLSFSVTKKKVLFGADPTMPKWTLISASIPQGKSFNYNAVAAYSVRITNWSGSGHTGYVRMHAWLNDITANPQTIQNAVSPRGSLYNLFALPGSARSPVSVQCQLPAGKNITKEITAPATGSWIVPPGVYSVQAEAWGAGGPGASSSAGRLLGGGGGGGGEYAQEPALSVIPGQSVPWSVGAPGTPGQLASTVVQYTSYGLGHWTCPANVTSVFAEMWGGGAAGGAGSGGGGGAEYAAVNMPVTPGVTYTVWTGKGGKADTGTSSAQVAARQGTDSWFGPPGNKYGITAFTRANGGLTSLTGSSSGGYGGTSGTVAPQTQMFGIGFSNPTAFTSTSFSLNSGTKALPAGNAGLITVTVPAASTITITDTGKNTWTQIASASVAGCVTYAFCCFTAVSALNAKSVITVKQTTSQAACMTVYNMPWVVAVDSAATSSSGTSTAPSITSGVPNFAGDLVLAIFSNAGANTSAGPAGWTSLGNQFGNGMFNNVYALQNAGTSAETATAAYASSEAWNSMALTFVTEAHWPGGRGGASPGPSGGGGGGAAGAGAAGGTGGDSSPFAQGVGRWQLGGAGGAGTGLGGSGGAGANTPGFPGAGTAPGGGGGGGYTAGPLLSAANPSVPLPGASLANFLGGDGGAGLVQLTYAVGGGNHVNGGSSTFGSSATTGTVVTAHGGSGPGNNSAGGGAGGSGSGNTIHSSGGAGALVLGGPLGSYLASPTVTTLFQTLSTMAYSSTANTSGTAVSSCAQGVAVALIESAAKVTDLVVTDSAGNVYQEEGVASAGSGGNGVTLYAYVANLEFPITTSTTLTVSSATGQQYGVIWYASPWLVAGVSPGNSGSSSGSSGSFSGQFGVADNQSIELELGVVLCDGSKTVNALTQTKTWFNAGSTNTLAAGTMNMAAYVMENQGGGTGSAASGDVFSGTLSATANWAVLCVPLTMINQTNALVKMDWRSGATPGAATSWATEAAISANGVILVLGQSGTGVTAAPTGVTDQGGNAYALTSTQAISGNGGSTMWAFVAPVTAALAAGATGSIHWGSASAAPEYWEAAYWLPNATAFDSASWANTGNSATASLASFTPIHANSFAVAVACTNGGTITGTPSNTELNAMDANSQSYLTGKVWAMQDINLTAITSTVGLGGSAPWGFGVLGFVQSPGGSGGGAAGGPGGPGYPGVWNFGGPGFAGGGKGGQGATTPGQSGNGAALPGGGGGGGLASVSTAAVGGQGGGGALRLSWAPPLQAFNTLIVHSLGAGTDPNVNPIVPVPITDIPNNTEYPVPSVNGLLPATFSSTYSVILANFLWNPATTSRARTITVTVNQYEYPGGPKYSVTCSRAITPATDSTNGLLSMGEVTLPVKDYLSYNDQSYFTISVNDSDTSDRFMDVLFLDTTGQTVIINIDPGQPGYGQYVNYFIDEPTSDRDLGFVGASFQDRQHQMSVIDYAQIAGGPLYIGPGDNLFMVYSTSGAPNLAVSYAPRWYLDRSA